jgi:formiminoglutamate deiminase
MTETVYHCEFAHTGGSAAEADVQITVSDGRITRMTPRAARVPHAVDLPGLTLPGMANTHSHVFHRAIRGRTQSGAADFWQWRNVMYRAASRLTPDNLYALARATYGEMLAAGITSVGEFFYVHHRADGSRYSEPNEMGLAVARAATDAGIRLTLLDTCYLQAGVDGAPPQGAQIRYSDGSWQAWAERVDALRSRLAGEPLVRVGAAIHSVRAVPRAAMAPIARFCRDRDMPLHAHVSEQPAENEACLAVFGLTPVELLAEEGVLSASFTAVHATHLTDRDIELLVRSRSFISMCPTTERDLADGVGPAIRLAAAGSPLTVGSDGHMMIDLLEEGRAVELDERLVTGVRGHLTAPQIARALTTDGARSIGWPSGGLAVGAPADMTTIKLDSVRTAGARSGDVLAHVLFAATAADVDSVIVGGSRVVEGGTYLADPELGASIDRAIAAL